MHLLVLALLFSPQVQTPELCAVSGTVVDSVTGEPLNKVDILLEPAERGTTHTAVTISDPKGRFGLVDVAPAAYHLLARRSGYLETNSRIRLEMGQALTGVAVKLVPSAVLAGTVRDSDGEPLEGAHVILARRTYRYGTPRVEGEDSTDTDDRGEYRFRDLTAGRYYVGVEPKSLGSDHVDHSPVAVRTTTVPTLYPGVTDVSQAAPIEVATGQRAAGIDVTLLRSSVFRVSGRVSNAPGGLLTVALHDPRNTGMRDYNMRTTTKNASGDFEFRGVPAGSYVLSASAGSLTGKAPVVVGAADVEGARLSLAPAAEVQLRFSSDEKEKPDVSGVNWGLTTDGRRGLSAFPFAANRLMIRNVPPDHYTFWLIGALLRRFYVKSARVGDTDVLSEGLDVTGPGTITIDVVLASDGASIKGAVRNKDDQPLAGVTVVLAPEQRSNTMRFASTTTDQNGRYEFTSIAPGDYKLFAWEDVEEDAWNDPEFLKQYEKQGEKASLEPKARTTVNLRAATKPDQP
jgi:hypothetical protein